MATIRKHRERWQVQVRRQGHPSISRSFSARADAVTWARQTESDLDRKALTADPRALDRLPLGNILQRYKESVTPRKRGCLQERYRIDQLAASPMAKVSLGRLTPGLIAKYRDNRLESVKPATVRRELAILRHVLETARKEWDVPLFQNPVSVVSLPSLPTARARRLSEGELQRLLDGCSKRKTPLLDPIIRFAIETGLRRGELVAARWEHASIDQRLLFVPQTKNGHPRTIPLTSAALQILEGLPRGDERVFPVTGNAVRLAWERLKQRVGIDDLHFHDLRHEAISRFFEMGLSVPEVALISGHRDYRMLFRYTHLRAEDVGKKLL